MFFFHRVTNETCDTAAGLVVAIDVVRAFTMAAFAFAAGAKRIFPVRTTDEAFALKTRFPGALLMGEIGGRTIPGFDYGNSPTSLVGLDLTGRTMIQRTGAGTQGLAGSIRAETLLAASFVCAGATARYIQALAPSNVTFVITGYGPNGRGDEDAACADYLEGLLTAQLPDPAPYLERVRQSKDGMFHHANDSDMPYSDLEHCTALDKFDFAMPVRRENGLLVMEPATGTNGGLDFQEFRVH